MGATDTVDPTTTDVPEAVRSLTGGRGADYVFEVAGVEQTLSQAFELTRRGGTLVLVAVHAPTATTMPWSAFEMFLHEKKVLGCFYGAAELHRDVPRLIALIETGRLDVGSMVSRRLMLDEVNDGLTAMEKGEVIRSVIVGQSARSAP
jgi:S-(hydroxymethyl)glutathione dehydrogenase/alcohol dehydrogenase